MVAVGSIFATREFSNALTGVAIPGSIVTTSAAATPDISSDRNNILDAVNASGKATPDVLARRIQDLLDSFGITAPTAIADSDASPPVSTTPKDPSDQNKVPDAVKTLDQTRQDVLAYRKKDALNRLDRARKDLELLRTLGGDEKSVAWKAKQVAEQIGKAAVEYGDAARGIQRSADAAVPDQQTDALTVQVSAPSTDGKTAANPDATGAPDAGSGATDSSFAASTTQTGTPSDQTSASPTISDADAVKAFSEAEAQVKKVFDELVLKGKIQHTHSRDWVEALRAQSKMDQEIEDLGDQIGAGQSASTVSESTVSVTAVEVQTSVSISVDVLA